MVLCKSKDRLLKTLMMAGGGSSLTRKNSAADILSSYFAALLAGRFWEFGNFLFSVLES